MNGAAWSPAERYRLPEGHSTAQTELNAIATPAAGAAAAANPLHPDNPLLWFGVIAAVTFGLMGFSTSGRVGNARVSLSAGKT